MRKSKMLAENLTITVVSGHGQVTTTSRGYVAQVSIIAPTNAVFGVAISNGGYGVMGRSGLAGDTTICENFICLSGSIAEIQNATTDGTYYMRLLGDLEG